VFSTCPSHLFFPAPATTELYTLSLHDALPIYSGRSGAKQRQRSRSLCAKSPDWPQLGDLRAHRMNNSPAAGQCPEGNRCMSNERSEEHTSELQSRGHLVCRLLLEKKKIIRKYT